MSILLKVNLIISCLLLLLIVFYNITRNNLQIKYSLVWIFSSVIFLIFAVFPQIVVCLTKLIGMQVSSNSIFLFMNLFFYFMFISLTISISKASTKMSKMVQEVGLLKYQVDQMQKMLTMDKPHGNGEQSN